MNNVKTVLIFITISTFVFASEQRVNSLGGNVGHWADDDNSWTAFPHTLNNSNLAQVSGLGEAAAQSHSAIVRWGEGTKWGFSWDQNSENDMLNLQWGNGSTIGATFGLSMSAEDNGDDTDGKATSTLGISVSGGMEMGFGELGVGFSNSSEDDGDELTKDDPASMGLWVNFRRAQSIWLFDNILVNFAYDIDNDPPGDLGDGSDEQTTISLSADLFTHIDIGESTTGLLAMGFGYGSVENVLGDSASTVSLILLPVWIFAVESAMTDWATCRVGVNASYIISRTANSGDVDDPATSLVDESADETARGGINPVFSVGLGFNYGSFNLDIDVSESLFTSPVEHVVGFEQLNETGTTATLTYIW